MRSSLRTVLILIGILFLLQGIGWILAPGRAAAGLGMSVLDGLGRSTQFGDFAAFFLMLGGTILAGTRPGRARVLYFPAGMLGSAAFCRTLAWLFHGAAFAATFITVEIVACVLLIRGAGEAEKRAS